MKKTLLLLIAFLGTLVSQAQVNIPYQEINYNVHYHWGLINVMIAHGKVTIQTDGNQFKGTLDGNSIPWEGRVFCISDTLNANMTPASPVSNETVTYENGWYLKPKVTQYRSGSFNPDDPANYKNIKGQGTLNADGNTMEAISVTTNMLGMYYYFQEIDFENMTQGQQLTIPIEIEGSTPERVVVTYKGNSNFNAAGNHYATYSVDFEYSYNGVMSGYPVQCEVSASTRLPLMFSANLPIGKVEMIYDGE